MGHNASDTCQNYARRPIPHDSLRVDHIRLGLFTMAEPKSTLPLKRPAPGDGEGDSDGSDSDDDDVGDGSDDSDRMRERISDRWDEELDAYFAELVAEGYPYEGDPDVLHEFREWARSKRSDDDARSSTRRIQRLWCCALSASDAINKLMIQRLLISSDRNTHATFKTLIPNIWVSLLRACT